MSLPVRFARSGNLFIAYTAEGSAPPTLVVNPGHFLQLEVAREWPPFSRFIDRLGSFSRVIFLDRRGTGLSDGMPPTTPLDDAMDDVRAVMDHAGIERAVLMGGAEGEPTCMLFAATFPDLAVMARVRDLGVELRVGVHIGARVAALAAPGEVLVSGTVRDLVVGSGFVFKERGRHELKGVPGEWHVFTVDQAPIL